MRGPTEVPGYRMWSVGLQTWKHHRHCSHGLHLVSGWLAESPICRMALMVNPTMATNRAADYARTQRELADRRCRRPQKATAKKWTCAGGGKRICMQGLCVKFCMQISNQCRLLRCLCMQTQQRLSACKTTNSVVFACKLPHDQFMQTAA